MCQRPRLIPGSAEHQVEGVDVVRCEQVLGLVDDEHVPCRKADSSAASTKVRGKTSANSACVSVASSSRSIHACLADHLAVQRVDVPDLECRSAARIFSMPVRRCRASSWLKQR